MFWHYRFINLPSINGGDDHITLKEVHYNDDKTMIGFCDPCTYADDAEDLALLKKHMVMAWDNPVIQESELPPDVLEMGVLR